MRGSGRGPRHEASVSFLHCLGVGLERLQSQRGPRSAPLRARPQAPITMRSDTTSRPAWYAATSASAAASRALPGVASSPSAMTRPTLAPRHRQPREPRRAGARFLPSSRAPLRVPPLSLRVHDCGQSPSGDSMEAPALSYAAVRAAARLHFCSSLAFAGRGPIFSSADRKSFTLTRCSGAESPR